MAIFQLEDVQLAIDQTSGDLSPKNSCVLCRLQDRASVSITTQPMQIRSSSLTVAATRIPEASRHSASSRRSR